jgi:two-component system, OmpR family, response regulator
MFGLLGAGLPADRKLFGNWRYVMGLVEKQKVCLVIEDDPDIRGLISAVLGRAGFDVRTAGSGAEGIAAAASLDLALVTLDMGLPDMDGHDAVRSLRAP